VNSFGRFDLVLLFAKGDQMNNIFYLIGVVVVVLFIARYFGIV
jgi:hypothetical protein